MATELTAADLRSKDIKRMQMEATRETLGGVTDFVLLHMVGEKATSENTLRLDLRKKDIRLFMVKNSLARKVLGDMGIQLEGVWDKQTTIAWGGDSIAGLSKELEKTFKGKEHVSFKAAVVEGQQITFDQALKMPTREEAIAHVLGLVMAPASRLSGALRGPAARLSGQLKAIAEKSDEEAAAS